MRVFHEVIVESWKVGIDTSKYSAHSIRSASKSAAKGEQHYSCHNYEKCWVVSGVHIYKVLQQTSGMLYVLMA